MLLPPGAHGLTGYRPSERGGGGGGGGGSHTSPVVGAVGGGVGGGVVGAVGGSGSGGGGGSGGGVAPHRSGGGGRRGGGGGGSGGVTTFTLPPGACGNMTISLEARQWIFTAILCSVNGGGVKEAKEVQGVKEVQEVQEEEGVKKVRVDAVSLDNSPRVERLGPSGYACFAAFFLSCRPQIKVTHTATSSSSSSSFSSSSSSRSFPRVSRPGHTRSLRSSPSRRTAGITGGLSLGAIHESSNNGVRERTKYHLFESQSI